MMLYPSLAELLGKVDSRYLLVNAIAKRAREVSMDEEKFELGDEKPVSRAIKDIAADSITVENND